jgi:glutathione S-transferase
MTDFPKSATARFTLYGASISPFVRKIRVLLAEKAIPYELVPVNIFAPPPWFATISPLKRIPVLHDAEAPGTGVLADSSVIAAYLEKLFPTPALYPAAAWDYAQALWLEEYCDTDLIACAGREVFRPRVVSRFLGQSCDEQLVHKGMTQSLPPFFAYLEARIAGRSHFVGDTLTLADIAVAAPFVNLKHAGERPDPATYPALTDFLGRMFARSSFAALIAEETAFLARVGKAA